MYVGRPTLVGKALSFTHELSFSFLSIHHAQQPRSAGHQMYSGGSIVGKASTIAIGLSPTLP